MKKKTQTLHRPLSSRSAVEKIDLVKNAQRYGRRVRRTLWKQLRESDGISWKEYLEIEAL